YTHYSYGSQSKQSRTAQKNNFELAIQFKNPILTPKLYFDYLFGSGTHDASLTLEVTHEFDAYNVFTSDDALRITPGAYITAGTVNALSNSKSKKNSKESAFEPTGAELSLPVEYDIGRFSIEAALHRSVPFNQPKKLNASPVTYFTIS